MVKRVRQMSNGSHIVYAVKGNAKCTSEIFTRMSLVTRLPLPDHLGLSASE
jgi:hypothetical protein